MPTLEQLKRNFPTQHKPPSGATTRWEDVHPGATRNWHPSVRVVAEFLEWKFGCVCTTYNLHGENDDGATNGEPFAIDLWFGRDNICADANNTQYGIKILRFIERRPRLFNWHYLIINHWYLYRGGVWSNYDPFSQRYCKSRGNTNPCDCDHDNHLLIQFKRSILVRMGVRLAVAVGLIKPQAGACEFACAHPEEE
ncbi:MAG: hypothetical protein M3437_03125 [Chloroflexota bacterium]|nr:hypothetical protein [Chloroflexota bacterium]